MLYYLLPAGFFSGGHVSSESEARLCDCSGARFKKDPMEALCVCACVRACVRACVCVCVLSLSSVTTLGGREFVTRLKSNVRRECMV